MLIAVGILMIGTALGLTCYNLWTQARTTAHAQQILEELLLPEPTQTAEAGPTESSQPSEAAQTQPTQPASEPALPAYVEDPFMDMPEREVEGVAYIGYIEIPAMELRLPVITETTTALLKIAPCRLSGSVYLDDMVVGAHNMEGLFKGIGSLETGTQILFTDMDGNVFIYSIVSTEQLGGNDLEQLLSGDWDLTLYTCTYTGAARVVVRCQRISQS